MSESPKCLKSNTDIIQSALRDYVGLNARENGPELRIDS